MKMTDNNTVKTINPWLTTIAVMTATFIFVLDGTIANVALPQMAGSFSSSNDEAVVLLYHLLIGFLNFLEENSFLLLAYCYLLLLLYYAVCPHHWI